MFIIRPSHERGHFDHGWLKTYHTFSFSEYHDPKWMDFRSLRVMNEDVIAPGQGFGTHGHRDMEIITHVLSGQLEHRDSLGNGGILTPGDLQHMTAGSGIRHSEFNPSPVTPVHLYQVWLLPQRTELSPGYEQTRFDPQEYAGRFRVIASPDGRDGSLKIHQDAQISLANLAAQSAVQYPLDPRRFAWLQVLRGNVEVSGREFASGDGAAIGETEMVAVQAISSAEIMLFDLA